MITMFVGDITDVLALTTKEQHPSAQLLTEDNLEILSNQNSTFYLSLGDFNSENNLQSFINVLDKSDTIVYSPPNIWSDVNDQGFSELEYWSKLAISYFVNKKEIINYQSPVVANKEIFLELSANRVSESNQIWLAGARLNQSTAVEMHHFYGNIIANKLNLPISYIFSCNSNLLWAADQLLRSDIQSGDTVIWDLTNYTSFPYYNSSIEEIRLIDEEYYQLYPEFDFVISADNCYNENQMYRVVTSIYQVLNFCSKINAKILLTGLLIDDKLHNYLCNLPNYINLSPNYQNVDDEIYHPFVDHDSLQGSPGQKTLELFANQILKYL